MPLPAISGIIDRRILVNYRIDPDVMRQNLPSPFRPKLARGYAIGGICLIRMKQIKPRFIPIPWGIRSENAAHRIAVEWDDNGECRQGVYIPRRDSDSMLNTLLGGRLFPGIHHHATFDVQETNNDLSVKMTSKDGLTHIWVSGVAANRLPESSIFRSLTEASDFFEQGSLGYSNTRTAGNYDGLELCCKSWQVEPMKISRVESSYFENTSCFPAGSVTFDCALLMRSIDHVWYSRPQLGR